MDFWEIMMYQCRFISCEKCTTLMEGAVTGGAVYMCVQWEYGKSLYLPFSFSLNL
jgi:hypothetical protein